MSTTAVIQTRVDVSLRDRASAILDDLGLDVTTAIRMFLKALVREEALPFEAKIDPFYSKENQEWLKKSIDDLEAGRGIVVKTMDELKAME